jgi:hypothetical protein
VGQEIAVATLFWSPHAEIPQIYHVCDSMILQAHPRPNSRVSKARSRLFGRERDFWGSPSWPTITRKQDGLTTYITVCLREQVFSRGEERDSLRRCPRRGGAGA